MKKIKLTHVVIALCAIYCIMSVNSARRGGDFEVFVHAAGKLSNGQNIYVPPFLGDLQYFYSPLFALLLIPFANHFFVIALAWLLLSGFLLYRCGVLLFRYTDLSVFSKKETYWLVAISSFFIIRFLLYNTSLIQITIFILWAILESVRLAQKDRWLLAGALLGLAINIKIMPAVALPYLLYRGYFKASAAVLAFMALYLILPSIFIGHNFNVFLLSEWWAVINPANGEHLIEADRNAQSLVGLVPVFLTPTQGELDISRNVLNLSTDTAHLITNLVRLAFVAFTLYFLGRPFTFQINNLAQLRALAYICLITPLIFPHQQKYAFLFIYPMVVYLSYYCFWRYKFNKNTRFKIYLYALLLISLMFTPLIGSDVITRRVYDLIHHFRLLGIFTIMLIGFALLAKPRHLTSPTSTHLTP